MENDPRSGVAQAAPERTARYIPALCLDSAATPSRFDFVPKCLNEREVTERTEEFQIGNREKTMKIATIIARSLLGLIFVVFGLNAFLQFMPMPPPKGLAGDFTKALFVSHYFYVV